MYFRADSILKSDWDFISNCMSQTSRDRETIAIVCEDTKRTRGMCSPIGHNNTKYFLCPIRSRHPLEFLEMVHPPWYPGALPPLLENYCRAFSPDPTDCPWVSEDGSISEYYVTINHATHRLKKKHFSRFLKCK